MIKLDYTITLTVDNGHCNMPCVCRLEDAYPIDLLKAIHSLEEEALRKDAFNRKVIEKKEDDDD